MHHSAKYPGGTEEKISLVVLETKLNGEENTIVTRLKPDITAYRCRRKKYAENYETQHKIILDYISNITDGL